MGRLLLIALFALLAVEQAAAAGPKKKVRIETVPDGASVYIDDVELGEVCKTNCTIDVEDDATLIIALDGHKPEIVQFSVGRRERPPFKRSYKLTPVVGKIIVEGPRGASIEVDDKPSGKAPLEIEVFAGPHTVVLTLDGKKVFADAVEVPANDEVRVGKRVVAGGDPPDDPDGDPDPPDGDGDPAITKPGKPARPRAGRLFAASAAVSVGFRNFQYNDVQQDAMNLNPSNEAGQVLIGPAFEVWPGVAFGVRALRGLSITGRAQFGVNPQEVLDEQQQPIGARTFWRTFEGSLRQRFTFGDFVSVEGNIGYVRDQHRFEGDPSQVPDADYTSLRLAIKLSANLGTLEPYVGYDNLVVMTGGGKLVENFPAGSTSVAGLRVSGGVAANLGHLAARLEASHTRYSWTFRMGDASGALDAITYVSVFLGYAY